MEIADFFDLTITNEQLYKVGEVEDGYTHGVEQRDGEYYATLYHLQKSIAKGPLKSFLVQFDGSEALAALGTTLRREYEFPEIQVRYKGQTFPINKYPFSAVLDYFKRSINQSVLADETPLPYVVENAINAIGFKHFRRFQQLDPLELKGITFFVGQNNSGKSSVIKALTLLSSYLNQDDLSVLKLTDPTRPESAHVMTFGRALNRTAKNNEIEFELFLKDFIVKLSATAKESDRELRVKHLIVYLGEFKTRFSYEGNIVRIEIRPTKVEETDPVSNAFEDIYSRMLTYLEHLNEQLENENLPITERLKLTDDKNRLELEIKRRLATKKTEQTDDRLTIVQEVDLNVFLNNDFLSLMEEAINLYIEQSNTHTTKSLTLQQQLNSIKISNKYIFDRSREFYELIHRLRSHHIGTNNGSQQALLLIRDNSNPLARVAHNYYKMQTDEGNTIPELFVKKWLGKAEGFGVADGLEVVSVEDEGYSIKLKDATSDIPIPLSDMGMGTQQIVLLVMTMAVLIDRYPSKSFTPMIMVEEPEVNLHPRLESKLTEFFLDVHENHQFKFIIETHSEYMIRKTQVLTKENKYASDSNPIPNPFKVYYFPQDAQPYEMRYREDGKFLDEFQSGFFDVNSKLVFDLL